MAAMMVRLRQAEADCYAREAKEREEKAKAEAAKNEATFGNGLKKGFFNQKSKK